MTERFYSYEPAKGHGLPHDPFNAIVGPRPIGWVSSCDQDGRVNLAPYSFFNAFNYVPPIIGFASTGWKDSARNIAATRAFTWNLVTRPLAEQMNQTCAPVPHGTSEFDLAGLTMAPSTQVVPPRVGESPVSFECKLTQMFRLQTLEGHEVETWMMFGQVVAVHIREDLLENGIYQTAKARPVVRAGGPGDYFEIVPETKFVMMRPRG